MVKFAEAEKRGRGGDGNDRRFAPIMMLERPKISRGMWESLKVHILRERRRKKEELEADAEEKRIRKEQENRKKQHAFTLEETREQISKSDQKLIDLKAQKHELVQQLKKVLNEEKRRKDQEQQQQHQLHQQNYMKENDLVAMHPYSHGSLSIGGHPQMIFPSPMVPGRPTSIPTLYKVGVPTSQAHQSILSAGSVKRSRSPSPQPSQSTYQQLPFVFKNLPGNQTSVVPVTLSSSKASSGANIYLSNQPPASYYHGSTVSHSTSSPYPPPSTQTSVVAPYLSTPGSLGSQASSGTPHTQTGREDKHLHSVYMTGGRAPTTHVPALHPSLDHKGKPIPSLAGSYPPADPQDKFYVSAGVRPHLVLHTTGVVPVQQSAPNGQKGSITSGFPSRVPLPPHTSQGQNSTSHAYSGHSLNLSRTYY